MLNILIVGLNRRSIKFISTLQFYDEVNYVILDKDPQVRVDMLDKLNINYLIYPLRKVTSLIMENFNLIILSVEDEIKINIANYLVSNNYKGKIIIDKPFCYDYISGNKLSAILLNIDYLIPYTNKNSVELLDNGRYNIIILNETLKDYYIDPIPHILEIVIDNVGYNLNIKFQIVDKYSFTFTYGKLMFNIKYGNTKNIQTILFNDIEVVYPNYYARYYELISILFSNNDLPSQIEIKKNKCMLFIINKYEREKIKLKIDKQEANNEKYKNKDYI